jgi:hypothetical protein
MMQFVLKYHSNWGLKWMTIFSALCIQVYDKLLTGIPFKIVFTILYLHNFLQEENVFYTKGNDKITELRTNVR